MTTALITGATSGLGRAFADKLAREGYDLVLVARDTARLEQAAGELGTAYGVDCTVLTADLTDPDQRAVVERVFAERPIEVLVNNAGYGQRKSFAANPLEVEEHMLDLMVRALLRLTHAAVQPMIERGSGAVVNVSSVAGFAPRGTYSAHKAWVTNFSASLAIQLHAKGIAVMALCPGFVRTEFHQRLGLDRTIVPDALWLDAAAVVDAAWNDLRRGKPVSIPTWRYKVIAAAAQHVPRNLVARYSTIGLDGRRRT